MLTYYNIPPICFSLIPILFRTADVTASSKNVKGTKKQVTKKKEKDKLYQTFLRVILRFIFEWIFQMSAVINYLENNKSACTLYVRGMHLLRQHRVRCTTVTQDL